MPFVESSQSLKSKMNLSNVSTPVLVGIVSLSIVACILVVQNSLNLFGVGDFTITKQDGAQVETCESIENGGSANLDDMADSDDMSSDKSSIDGAITQAESAANVVVFVSGAVVNPGVYTLQQGQRVQDAVTAAGGFKEDAAKESLNLARILQDGEQVDILTQEEADAGEAMQSGQSDGSAGAIVPQNSSEGLVNINTADTTQLETLPGIGPSTAEKIIADRESNGPFVSKEDLKRVSGIGDKKYESVQDLITVG